MMKCKCFFQFTLLALIFSLYSSVVRAQEEPQPPQQPEPTESAPKPAARAPFPVIDPGTQEPEEDLRPDFTPLTGLQTATLGTPGARHSYWVPGFQYASIFGPNPNSGQGWFADNYFLGNLTLLKAWTRSQFSVNYSVGEYVSSGNSSGTVGPGSSGSSSGTMQQLVLSENYQTNRWLFQVLDQFSYLPTSNFGYGVGTNLGVAGVGGSLGSVIPGLGNTNVINQSIYATNGPIYNNTGALQGTYQLTSRSSITLAGDYSILRFTEPGNVDSDIILGSLGYNYNVSRNDTLGVVYRFAAYHYQGQPQALGTHYVSLAYSKKITGKLALQFLAGPEITTYRVPIGSDTHQTGFSVNANVTYGTKKGSISSGYTHGLSNGSGVLVGSNLDQVTFSLNRRLSRVWSGNLNLGYAHNSGLAGSGQSSTSYDSFYGGGGVSRPLGRNFNLGLAYTAYISKTGLVNCTGPNCTTSTTTNTINLSLQWHTRPFVLE
jgi:hypothetical protein